MFEELQVTAYPKHHLLLSSSPLTNRHHMLMLSIWYSNQIKVDEYVHPVTSIKQSVNHFISGNNKHTHKNIQNASWIENTGKIIQMKIDPYVVHCTKFCIEHYYKHHYSCSNMFQISLQLDNVSINYQSTSLRQYMRYTQITIWYTCTAGLKIKFT